MLQAVPARQGTKITLTVGLNSGDQFQVGWSSLPIMIHAGLPFTAPAALIPMMRLSARVSEGYLPQQALLQHRETLALGQA